MKVQIALDFFDIDEAITLGEDMVEAGADWLEVGTPLIAGEGLKSVKKVKKEFPNHRVLADFKTLDAGGLFAEKAANLGADVVTVMAVAEDATIRAAIEDCGDYDTQVEVDLLAVPEDKLAKRAKQVEKMGADIVMFHTAIDIMLSDPSTNPIRKLPSVVEAVDLPVSVACVNSNYCLEAKDIGADTAVVGPGDLEKEEMIEFIREIRS